MMPFSGCILLTVPHMDDGVLGCGGTLAMLPDKSNVHVVYATDGRGSPVSALSWENAGNPDLNPIRQGEAIEAMTCLGVSLPNIHFLDLPDGNLRQHTATLYTQLTRLIGTIAPDHVLTPFRYDRHPDHLALNEVVTDLCRHFTLPLTEYFVYHHWRLLPKGDIRAYIHPNHLQIVDTMPTAPLKRAALDCFTSQTTRFFHWQTRPNLTPHLLDAVSYAPEQFLRHDPKYPDKTIFTHVTWWIPVAHTLEPRLKKWKDEAVGLIKRFVERD
jgi:LmbE family N-acetylglucosaminyl deacetylase